MVTAQRNLRTGRSIWSDRRALSVAHRRLTRDVETEVLIIGAGITGALIADALASEGVEVVIVDKRGLAKGSTVASTALVQYESDTPITVLSRKIGKEKAVRAWRRARMAVGALAARLAELGVSDVAHRDTLYLAGDILNATELRREHAARRAAGLPSRYLDRTALRDRFGIGRSAAILSYDNLTIDPRKATRALLHAATVNGARIFAPEDMTDIAIRKGGVTATTANRLHIRGRHLVFATGYELPHGVTCRHHKITSTWAIATVRQHRAALWPGECCLWEAADPYLYVRTTPDGRVICGGGDEDIADEQRRDALLDRKTAMLQRKLKRLLPKIDTDVDYAWTGTFGETTTGLPTIDEVPGMPRCFIALGYGGNGTTYAAIAADIIAGAIVGRPDVDADLYRFPAHDAAK
ncbi:MAG: FAD-binding oxidoreductase [Xanthobacteraceae bacterium]|nr:FAD-binding oxidoreductase [Xanthobacteraceae bacterium]MBX9826916.1 FAD-binding oxidoreductase [Xanthobacteraceae bacterium]